MQEYTIIFRDGFAKGLRAATRSPKNAQTLVLSEGAVPEDGVLRALEEINTFGHTLAAAWPFPQVFNLKTMTLVATQTELFSYELGVLTSLIAGLPVGSTWTVADYWPYIVATNGAVMVTRNPQSGVWAIYDEGRIPACRCLADLNGQLILGGIMEAGYA